MRCNYAHYAENKTIFIFILELKFSQGQFPYFLLNVDMFKLI